MALVGLDPERTRGLSTVIRSAGQEADHLSGEVRAALELSALESAAPIELQLIERELEEVGLVLAVRADVADGFVVDPTRLTDDFGLTAAEATAVLSALADTDADNGDTPLLDLVLAGPSDGDIDLEELADALGVPLSVLDLHVKVLAVHGIVEKEQVLEALGDAEELRIDSVADVLTIFGESLPANVVARLDSFYLPLFLAGESPDPDDLSDEQADDLRLLAAAIGGGDVTVSVNERYYNQNNKDHENRTIRVGLDSDKAPLDETVGFVSDRLIEGITEIAADRAVVWNVEQIGSGELSLSEASEASGISEARFARAMAVVDEARFRRTGERLDLGIIEALGKPTGDITATDTAVRSASVESATDLSALSDDELTAELDDIASEIVGKQEALEKETTNSKVAVRTLNTLAIGASFLGPVGVAGSITLGGVSLLTDAVARNNIERFDDQIRELRDRENELRQEQLDNALAGDDIKDFDIDTKDVTAIENEITEIENQIAELDGQREDTVDAGFLANANGTVQSGLFDTVALGAKGLSRVTVGGISAVTSGLSLFGQRYLDTKDLDKREELNELLEEREKLRRKQLREVGDPNGVFTEEEAVVELADAEFDLANEIAEAEQQRAELGEERDDAVAEQEKREAEAKAREEEQQRKKEEDQRQRDRSEPNGGQVAGADPGVGHNDVPDSF